MEDILRCVDQKEQKNNQVFDRVLQRLSRRNTNASKMFKSAIETIDLPIEKKVLFINRFVQQVEALEKKKCRAIRIAGLLNSFVSVGSVVTPALISVQYLDSTNLVFWTTFGLSTLTGISTAFISLFKLNKAKEIYTDAMRNLTSEGFKYLNLSDHYSTRDEIDAHDAFFSKFCSNVESILMNETRVTGGDERKEVNEIDLREIQIKKP